jgi:site-specific recombinase XerD
MRTLQEGMGHRDITTTQIYSDYCPNPHEAALVAAAFATRPLDAQPNLTSLTNN